MKQLKITKFPELDYAGSEAFNTLSTNLSFAGETVKKIMITSCHASEGKSYLSMNLMRTLAQRGMKVALVDAISSDAHNCTTRATRMQAAYERLCGILGQPDADALTGRNNALLLTP